MKIMKAQHQEQGKTMNPSKKQNMDDPRTRALEFRKERIFAIVNEFQKSKQMITMVQTLDWLLDAWEQNASGASKEEFQKYYSREPIKNIRQLLFGLDHLNSSNFNAKMYENSDDL